MKKPVVNLPLNSPSNQMITESISNFICGDLVPLSTVQIKHFRGLFSVLTEGKYVSPKRKHFTDALQRSKMNDST